MIQSLPSSDSLNPSKEPSKAAMVIDHSGETLNLKYELNSIKILVK